MYDELLNTIAGKGRCYLLLDEIQEIKDWEKAVNSLPECADVDVYVTGSNSKLMSSEISTYLTDRYVSIPFYTLSFRECLNFKADSTLWSPSTTICAGWSRHLLSIHASGTTFRAKTS